ITAPVADRWSPQITVGTPVLIPDEYVTDLTVRLALYRRLAEIDDEAEIEPFAAELVDRFGKLPKEVEHLLQIVAIKALCRRANVEKVDAGPKGVVLAFRDNRFPNPEGLIAFIGKQGVGVKIRPDQRVMFYEDWPRPEQRLKGAAAILRKLADIAERAKAA
ncbi:MAG TPA: TRCF domain-containing protein, partial [Pseudolabrys sp.]|nr:TRCF domain-containing protein [Pseudolabrys sp.]